MNAWTDGICWNIDPRENVGLGQGDLCGYRVHLDAQPKEVTWKVVLAYAPVTGTVAVSSRSQAISRGVNRIRSFLAQFLGHSPHRLNIEKLLDK